MSDNHDWQSEQDENIENDSLTDDDLRYTPENPDGDVDDEDDVVGAGGESVASDNPYDDGADISLSELDNNRESDEIERTFEDLTLAELVGQFFRSPGRTGRSLFTVTRSSRTSDTVSQMPIPAPSSRQQLPSTFTDADMSGSLPSFNQRLITLFTTKMNAQQVQLLLYLVAVVFGVIGSSLLFGSPEVRRTEENALVVGAPFLWLSFFIWLIAELYGSWKSLVDWWWYGSDRLTKVRWALRILPLFVWLTALLLFTDSMTSAEELALGLVQIAMGRVFIGIVLWVLIELGVMIVRYMARKNPAVWSQWVDVSPTYVYDNARRTVSRPIWEQISFTRVVLFVAASISSVLVWLGTPDNYIALPIIFLWFASAILWALTFAPLHWSFFDWATGKIDAIRRINWRANSWVVVAFALIMMLGIGFRFVQLDSLPSEMTSDHVEKILDSNRVYNGEYNIFFANNGGREPIQMYLMSLFSNLPGLGFNHFTLKLLAAIQSLVTLPILFWLGVEVMGEKNRRFGVVVGLLLMAMVAASYWHVAISRQALRIVMTPIFTALLMIFLARGMRHNRRSDYIKAALVLGFGLYAYQAIRMLPVVIVAGIFIAVLVRGISWRERFMYGVNLAVLVWISFMVFLPMLHYSTQDPDHFWRRTAGRLLGDDVITEQLADGTIVERKATTEEQISAFNANVPILMSNIRNALLMFNWKGDVGWISGVPNEPAMDIFTGTFLILGLAAWIALMIRSRDPVIWLMPVMIFIMLLPSALSIAYPLENPSHTRTSGAIPPAYLIVAFSMALIAFRFAQQLPKRWGATIAVIFCSGVILMANQRNASLYFNQYPPIYIESSYPYSEAGHVLKGFAESDGTFGNAFMIAYPHWWGHRAIGIAAGVPFWPNGIVTLSDLPNAMNVAHLRTDQFALDVNKDLLFFYSPDDEGTSLQLKAWFPEGREQEVQSYQPDDRYMLYRVPFLGDEGFQEFLIDAMK